jgi:hypothetical protein
LHRQRPDHVALGRHWAFKAARACPAGIEALEEVGAGLARVEGEADGIRLLAITGKWDIDVQLWDGEGVCDFLGGQGGIGLPVAIGYPPTVPCTVAKGVPLGRGESSPRS